MKIALITCDRLPQGVAEYTPLLESLNTAEIDCDICIWDQPHDWSQYDLCLLRSVWDYHEKCEAFMSWIKNTSLVTKIQNPAPVVAWNSNKKYLKELADHNIAIAPTVWLNKHNTTDLTVAMESLPKSKQYFLKPVIGADSSGTHRFNSTSIESAKEHMTLWTPSHEMMLQTYLPAVETYGEVSAILFNGEFSHAIRKIPAAGDYRVQDTYGAKDIAHNLDKNEQKLIHRTADFIQSKFGKTCYARIDLLQVLNNTCVINELELIEPSLFLKHNLKSANMFVKSLVSFT